MSLITPSDRDLLNRHREIGMARPELRSVYGEWFDQLLRYVDGVQPIIEIGSGPGLFKEYFPRLISTDPIQSPWIDVVCDASSLPFRSGSVGGLVMVDTLHHLLRPLDFMAEAGRVLQPGGRLAMIEPWITPLSFLLYRYFHHEDCCLSIDLAHPFNKSEKKAFDGNAVIPFKLLRHYNKGYIGPLRLILAHSFLGLPYLVTFGFKLTRSIPPRWLSLARACERMVRPLAKLAATRILLVWENTLDGHNLGFQP